MDERKQNPSTVIAVKQAVASILEDKLKQLRLDANLGVQEMADLCGFHSRQHVDNTEGKSGHRVTFGYLYLVCAVVGREPKDLMPTINEIIKKTGIKKKTINRFVV